MFDNVKTALEWGVTNFDASIAGLGGCPFIPNSGSNLSTNDLIKWANKNNYDTGIDLWDLDDITNWVMDKKEPSKMSLKIPSLSNPSMI